MHRETRSPSLWTTTNTHTMGPYTALANPAGLGMHEAVLRHTTTGIGLMFFHGSKLIDGLWTTRDIVISNVCVMPFGYGIGDHRMFVLNVMLESLIWSTPTKVVRPSVW